jgi:PilZ domain
VDCAVIERRRDTRVTDPAPEAIRVTLRVGSATSLINLSAGGALVETTRPLQPGARVNLQVLTAAHTFTVPAHVVRCAVWSLDAESGVTYRGALAFLEHCAFFREQATRARNAVPAATGSECCGVGNPLPCSARSQEL